MARCWSAPAPGRWDRRAGWSRNPEPLRSIFGQAAFVPGVVAVDALDQGGSGQVAEEQAGGAILIVENGAHRLRANGQKAIAAPRLHHGGGGGGKAEVAADGAEHHSLHLVRADAVPLRAALRGLRSPPRQQALFVPRHGARPFAMQPAPPHRPRHDSAHSELGRSAARAPSIEPSRPLDEPELDFA
jgi:hypothetical protein